MFVCGWLQIGYIKLYHRLSSKSETSRPPWGPTEGEQAKTVLNEFMRMFEERNPQLRVCADFLYMDEAMPHLHVDFVPFTTGRGRGLDTRVSMKKALVAQGFGGGSFRALCWKKRTRS